jgi:hypothetical protein
MISPRDLNDPIADGSTYFSNFKQGEKQPLSLPQKTGFCPINPAFAAQKGAGNL